MSHDLKALCDFKTWFSYTSSNCNDMYGLLVFVPVRQIAFNQFHSNEIDRFIILHSTSIIMPASNTCLNNS